MRTNPRRKFLLPREYLGGVTTHPITLQALRRARPLLFIVLAIPMAAYIWRGLHMGDWGWSLGGVAISAAFGWAFWQAIASGYVRTNHGEFLRADRPIGYWLSVAFIALGYTMGVAGILLAEYNTKT